MSEAAPARPVRFTRSALEVLGALLEIAWTILVMFLISFMFFGGALGVMLACLVLETVAPHASNAVAITVIVAFGAIGTGGGFWYLVSEF